MLFIRSKPVILLYQYTFTWVISILLLDIPIDFLNRGKEFWGLMIILTPDAC